MRLPRSRLGGVLLAGGLLGVAAGCGGNPPSPPTGGTGLPRHEGPLPRPGSTGGPVWLIGIDGATWEVVRPMAEAGELPNLRAMMEAGAHGVLRSEEPTVSPALWATVATGVPRAAHGVVNFVVRRPGSYDTVEAGPPDRRFPALWELVGAAGGTSAVISWFGSYPAEPVPGHYVSKRFDPEKLEPGQVHPPEFAERLRRDARVTMRRGDLEQIGWTPELRDALLDDARTLAALRVVLAEAQPDLVAVYFAGIDIAQHLTWRHMDPASQAFPEDGRPDVDLAGVIPAYYRYLDHTLGQLRELAPGDATLIVLSDHGAGPMRRDEAVLLQLPVLLEELGIQRQRGGEALAISELYRHDRRIWLNLQGVEPAGVVPLDQAGERAAAIAQRLRALRTDEGQKVFERVRDLVAGTGWQPGDPAIEVRFSAAASRAQTIVDGDRTIDMEPVRLRLPDVSGSHRPEGLLLLVGPSVRPGPLETPATLYDVAPTVLYLLGLPQDERMRLAAPPDAGVLVQAIEPQRLRRHPVRAVAAYPGTDRTDLLRASRPAEPLDPARDEAMKSLRGLGYIR